MRSIHSVDAGTVIRYTFPTDQGERTIEGARGGLVHIGQLGNQAYLVQAADGEVRAVPAHDDVAVNGEDFAVEATPVYLWLLSRQDETDRGEMVACIVAARTADYARAQAASHAQKESVAVWYGNTTVLVVTCIGQAEVGTPIGLVLADIWETEY